MDNPICVAPSGYTSVMKMNVCSDPAVGVTDPSGACGDTDSVTNGGSASTAGSAELGVGADPVQAAIAGLATVDRAMAGILRAIADAGPVDGMPAARLISLAARATGWDIRYLRRTTDTLRAMPGVWAAFDRGLLSWSQIRGITTAAKSLSVADRQELDRRLSAAITDTATAEPDRIVELAGDLAARLDDAATQRSEDNDIQSSYVNLQPDLFGGARLSGALDAIVAACVAEALDGAADPPVADDDHPVDADGNPIPKSWRKPTSRAGQLAEGLHRVCRDWLGGTDGDKSADDQATDDDETVDTDTSAPPAPTGNSRAAKPTALVVVDLNDLIDPKDRDDTTGGTPAATARLLWRLAGGRRRLSTARVHTLTCDAQHIPVLTDGNTPVAIGDAYDPIPAAIRRAAAARDQGCRFPGCDTPQQWTDLHHVIFREHHGPTELANLASLCRHCHNLVHKHGWHLTLHPDGRLTVKRGRWQFTSHPRLRPPRATSRAGPPDRTNPPSGPDPPSDRDPPFGSDSPEHPTPYPTTSPADPTLPF